MEAARAWRTRTNACANFTRSCKAVATDKRALECALCFMLRAEDILCGTPAAQGCTLHTQLQRCTPAMDRIGGAKHPFAAKELAGAAGAWGLIRNYSKLQEDAIFEGSAFKMEASGPAVSLQLDWLEQRSQACPASVSGQLTLDKLAAMDLPTTVADLRAQVDELKQESEALKQAHDDAIREEAQRRRRLAGVLVGLAFGLVGSGLLAGSTRLASDASNLVYAPAWLTTGSIASASGVVVTASVLGHAHSKRQVVLSRDADGAAQAAKWTTGLCALTTVATGALWLYAPLSWARHNDPNNLRTSASAYKAAAVGTGASAVCWTANFGLWREHRILGREATSRKQASASSRITPSVYPPGASLVVEF